MSETKETIKARFSIESQSILISDLIDGSSIKYVSRQIAFVCFE
jgi:hypothetical protein